MSSQSPVALVQNLYAAFGRGDLPFLLGGLTTDVEWVIHGPSSVPYAGTFRGHDEVGKFFSLLGGSLDFHLFEPKKFVCENDTVVVFGSERVTARTTGREYENPWVHHWVLRDGKVAAFAEYFDSGKVAAAFTA